MSKRAPEAWSLLIVTIVSNFGRDLKCPLSINLVFSHVFLFAITISNQNSTNCLLFYKILGTECRRHEILPLNT